MLMRPSSFRLLLSGLSRCQFLFFRAYLPTMLFSKELSYMPQYFCSLFFSPYALCIYPLQIYFFYLPVFFSFCFLFCMCLNLEVFERLDKFHNAISLNNKWRKVLRLYFKLVIFNQSVHGNVVRNLLRNIMGQT